MSDTDNREPPETFIAKFHERWPEWGVAIAFIAPGERDALEAWLALLQEFADAAWGGSQAAPGLAKLAWWQDELLGWSRGARRHPLAQRLRSQTIDWPALGHALNVLPATRDGAADGVAKTLQPLAGALAQAEARLAGQPVGQDDAALLVAVLLGERALRHGDADEAQRVLATWPRHRGAGSGGRRIQAELLRRRLLALADRKAPQSLAAWRVLPLAWRAARG
ncbi:hypothetical protein E4582_04710 [Luteimonas yindakuii]|uniref:Phytoene/squalene synthase family protein n=1 Tax=Luteimonas yindakuii TaxID=2565782 RepID=A0A4Z1RDA6_9GAMM|nr:hypothetical protein [Luteimonas yindakuii]TKS54143.1 hypothetical protein E4582_04710 [Luteimonas yindakuii]